MDPKRWPSTLIVAALLTVAVAPAGSAVTAGENGAAGPAAAAHNPTHDGESGDNSEEPGENEGTGDVGDPGGSVEEPGDNTHESGENGSCISVHSASPAVGPVSVCTEQPQG